MQMSFERKIRRYQQFLKSLRQPESKLCSCPSHLHPRPWIHAPCLATRSHEEATSFRHKRSVSDPELRRYHPNILHQDTQMMTNHQTQSVGGSPQPDALHSLYKEATVLKEALRKLRQGRHLSKGTRNVVKKWSQRSTSDMRRKKGRKSKADGGKSQQLEALDHSLEETAQEEEALRQELKEVREAAQSRQFLEEENLNLKRKVKKLYRKMMAQEQVRRASVASDLDAEREEYVNLTLRKKYDDLLHYVLKIESENQKLKSLTGLSGDAGNLPQGYEDKEAAFRSQAIEELHAELESVRGEMLRKNNLLVECEERLQAMEALKSENIALHKSLKSNFQQQKEAQEEQSAFDMRTTAHEEEWMRRLAETREMYERAIQGYRDQLLEVQEKSQHAESVYTREIENLMHKLSRAQANDGMEEEGSQEETDVYIVNSESTKVDPRREMNVSSKKEYESKELINKDDHLHDSSPGTRVSDDQRRTEVMQNPNVREESTAETSEEKQELVKDEQEIDTSEPAEARTNVNIEQNHNSKMLSKNKNVSDDRMEHNQNRSCEENGQVSASISQKDKVVSEGIVGPNRLIETVDILMRRLSEVRSTNDKTDLTQEAIKQIVTECLQEWSKRFQQHYMHQEDSVLEMKKQLEDIQRKLKSKTKKYESSQKQCKHLEEKNCKLKQQCSQLEAKVASLESASQSELLHDLPKTLLNTEEKLAELRGTLHQAQEENMALKSQLRTLQEKLGKKELRMKSITEQNTVKEKETSELKEKLIALQHQLESVSKEVDHLQEQLSTKDSIMEHTSAQLEERIRECASLSSELERIKRDQNTKSEQIRAKLSEQDSAANKLQVEAQAHAAQYQAQLSTLRAEKSHIEKSLRQHIRKLEEQIDQLQLRNTTLQRQLTTITSTYHTMFSSIDLQPTPASPGHGTSSKAGL